ncbi:Gfo/Idh/MocA family protein [Paenibacillus sp. UNC451MF]|uniref:Gfo/Idh/MocA family protein n=1 Tax=Paenibacillus sp. UNC451MF TaxID=1449063 RepID=UPI00055D5B5F|nr:Gfo/Idh/MocA family oxidoreductase [Paenibacillus sp. UNC451MF]
MRVAIIGCGARVTTHAECFMKIPDVEVVRVYDLQEKRATELAERCKTKVFTSFERLITEANPDAVSLCLPVSMHKEFIKEASRYGKHVICESPIALSLADAREVIDVCDSNGTKLLIGHPVRFLPSYASLRQEIKSEAIGDIGVVHMKRIGLYQEEALGKIDDSAYPRSIFDFIIHDIDFIRSVLGEVKSVYALNRRAGYHDVTVMTLRFNNGAIANLQGHVGHPEAPSFEVEFAGRSGLIRFNSKHISPIRIHKPTGVEGLDWNHNDSLQDSYLPKLKHFVDCLANGKEPIITAEDSYKALEIALAAVHSIRAGVPIPIDSIMSQKGGNSNGSY